ncbi:hypothetical protein SELMODRAFT_427362 [Selaginella moellendorffii]|uniref:Uncharacterized protein n=1 Tax=Selaginella moellendorffii TaxID=88036 RepID=D8SZC1_SELML|nr:hypothetical protein SELMODRAFT_427362 [Selaginella moellendorffii]
MDDPKGAVRLRSTASSMEFPGYEIVYRGKDDEESGMEKNLPSITLAATSRPWTSSTSSTSPYTEGSLVKKEGGRAWDREAVDKQRMRSRPDGGGFTEFLDYGFTVKQEEQLVITCVTSLSARLGSPPPCGSHIFTIQLNHLENVPGDGFSFYLDQKLEPPPVLRELPTPITFLALSPPAYSSHVPSSQIDNFHLSETRKAFFFLPVTCDVKTITCSSKAAIAWSVERSTSSSPPSYKVLEAARIRKLIGANLDAKDCFHPKLCMQTSVTACRFARKVSHL